MRETQGLLAIFVELDRSKNLLFQRERLENWRPAKMEIKLMLREIECYLYAKFCIELEMADISICLFLLSLRKVMVLLLYK